MILTICSVARRLTRSYRNLSQIIGVFSESVPIEGYHKFKSGRPVRMNPIRQCAVLAYGP